jgi:membrane protein
VLIAFSFLLVFVPILQAFVEKYVPSAHSYFVALDQLRYPVAIVLLFAGLYIAHRVLPARRIPPRQILPGVAITVLVWIILATLFSQWLVRFDTFSSTYASLSGLFAAMFFVYLAALVLIFGGELNRVLQNIASKGSPKAHRINTHVPTDGFP